MSSFDELGRIKRKIYKGTNFTLSITVKVKDMNDTPFKFSQKTKLQNGLITLNYNPSNAIVIESGNGLEKQYMQFHIEEYFDILDSLIKIYRSMLKDDMFYKNKEGEQFINKELQKANTKVLKNFGNNLIMEPDLILFFGEIYEGMTMQINNSKKIPIPYFEIDKLIRILTKTDLILLSEQILTNGLLINMMDKETKSILEFTNNNNKHYETYNKNILR